MEKVITTERDGHVFLVGLNRPEKRNAVNTAMIKQLAAALTEYEHDDDLRACVIFPHGDHFCGGLELAEVAGPLMDPGSPQVHAEGDLDPWGILSDLPTKPVLLAAKGYTLTVAIEMCLAADIVCAADDAKFAQLEISRGLYPIGGATTRWQLASGYQNAMRYLLTGDWFDAEEARRIGLVQDIVPADEVVDYTIAMAHRIAKHAPLGVRATIKTARAVQDHGHRAGADLLYPLINSMYFSEDGQLGIKTFLDKERPTFKGR